MGPPQVEPAAGRSSPSNGGLRRGRYRTGRVPRSWQRRLVYSNRYGVYSAFFSSRHNTAGVPAQHRPWEKFDGDTSTVEGVNQSLRHLAASSRCVISLRHLAASSRCVIVAEAIFDGCAVHSCEEPVPGAAASSCGTSGFRSQWRRTNGQAKSASTGAPNQCTRNDSLRLAQRRSP
jgi:hypothetical protein